MAKQNQLDAKRLKNDEFYTQFHDIEKEMNAYLDFNPEVFRNKTVLLPCDDPEWSNFTKYFAQNFEKLGLKKLISTSYAPGSKPKTLNLQPTLFELDSPQYDESKAVANGKIFTLTHDITGDNTIDVEDLRWEYLEGDGDFRSDEILKLRDEADIIVTNPPFSLFREFLAWVTEADKGLVMIGNMNALTYREVFPMIRENKLWLGNGFHNGNAYFATPTSREYAAGVFDVDTGLVKFRNAVWFTNLDHGRRHEPLPLMTEADNIKFSKHKAVRGVGYRTYDNYEAIEVPFTDSIPADFPGVMGVPISFLHKYNPDQFEIVDLSRYAKTKGMSKEFVDAYYASGQTGQISEGHPDLCYFDQNGNPVIPYMRILVRHRKALS
ncbi:adenine-specific methyltransferase EcoRI family protein [Aurantimicrobium minutum]|uniref:adenine-specific methyltransferase EcoRI family protein n=1 Tax=Aurantimicrobium minutum TaxID=708131 RepID=UPI00248F12A3|nr:adenine-specific methyltransferase EcoRI family protein [Aurantimicrobium minutum]